MKRNDLSIWPYGVLMSITCAILPFSHRLVSVELSSCGSLDSMYQLYLPNVVELIRETNLFASLPSTAMTIGQLSVQMHGVNTALLLLIIHDIISYKHGRVPFWCMLPIVAFAFHPARAAVLGDACGWPHTAALCFLTLGALAYMRDLCRIGRCYSHQGQGQGGDQLQAGSGAVGDDSGPPAELAAPCSNWYGAFKAVVVAGSFAIAAGLHVSALIVPLLLAVYHFVFHQYCPAGEANAAADRASSSSRRWVSIGMLLAGGYAAVNMALLAKKSVDYAAVGATDAGAEALVGESSGSGGNNETVLPQDGEIVDTVLPHAGVDVWYELSYCLYRMATLLMLPSVRSAGFAEAGTAAGAEVGVETGAGEGAMGEDEGVPWLQHHPGGRFEGASVGVLCSVALTMTVSLVVWGQTLLVLLQQVATNVYRMLFSAQLGGRQRIGEHVLSHTGFTRTCIIVTIYLLLCYWQMALFVLTRPRDDPQFSELASSSGALAQFVAYHRSGSGGGGGGGGGGIDQLLLVWSYIPSSFVSAYLCVLIADAFALPSPPSTKAASNSNSNTNGSATAPSTSPAFTTASASAIADGLQTPPSKLHGSSGSMATAAQAVSAANARLVGGDSATHLNRLSFLRSPLWLQAIIVLLVLHLVGITSQYLLILQN